MLFFRSGNYETESQYLIYTMDSFIADVGGYLVVRARCAKIDGKVYRRLFHFNLELFHPLIKFIIDCLVL